MNWLLAEHPVTVWELLTQPFAALTVQNSPRFGGNCGEAIPLRRGERCNLPHEGMDRRGVLTASSRPLHSNAESGRKPLGELPSVSTTDVAQVVLPDPSSRRGRPNATRHRRRERCPIGRDDGRCVIAELSRYCRIAG
jgi:hypothetical protein